MAMEMIDNKKLEELLVFDQTNSLINPDKFLNLLKKSQMVLPADFTKDTYTGLETVNSDGEIEKVSFDINCLTTDDALKSVPLFTGMGVIEKHNLKTSVVLIHMRELAEMLEASDYSAIVVNPFTEQSIDIPIDMFLELFEDDFKSDLTMLDLIAQKSETLKMDTLFFIRSDDDFMKDQSADGVYVCEEIFNVNSRDKNDAEYLNILVMPESSRIMYIGGIFDDAPFDTVIAPGSEFELVKEIDSTTRQWRCIRQEFFE